MRHGGSRCSPVPVLYSRGKPDRVTLPDLYDWSAPFLDPADASRNDQPLPCRMGVPVGAGAWFKRDISTGITRRIIGGK